MSIRAGFIDREESKADVNIGPLIDMVFILLIFFVITTNFTRQTGIDVNKPQAQTAVYQGSKTILIGISPEGTVHIHGKQVSLESLSQILSSEQKKRPDASVVIIGDRGADLGRAVDVMDMCLLAGLKNVSVAADKK